MTLHDELRAIALAEFATSGYAATSLQRIADLAGTSKASVLYHFASKELLLADIVSPAVDDLDRLLDSIDTASGLRHADFVEKLRRPPAAAPRGCSPRHQPGRDPR
ncbi:MAG: TetR/AcrR family transcriptional regulator [Microcella pacifica]